ncbi:energy-coupling factor transporter transmembrane component T family protein [Ornithinibacillus salinisoli]|uniref:Energy-coupling factor transporter transmembrane component T family protein n=1 Tax=Ornithinibacillus salinisoli TaxID=1848459 RepID=A0ABW4VVN2_9BACI
MISSINPSIKAFAILIPGILLSLTFDIFTPLVYLIFTIAVTFLFTEIPFKKWIKIYAPFIFVALGFAWMTTLYASENFSGGDVLFKIWMFEVTTGNMMVGISLALRSLCFVALSLLFILTTDSTKFMLSLMQQCKLPPKITYGVLAGYRFLPTFQNEMQILRQAHRIRGVGRSRGVEDKLGQFKRYSIPLLANGIRKAERVAIAMESKGFTGTTDRTHYHKMTVKKRDWIFFTVMIGTLFIVGGISYALGYLNIFGTKM